jgi:hypothetical protein
MRSPILGPAIGLRLYYSAGRFTLYRPMDKDLADTFARHNQDWPGVEG